MGEMIFTRIRVVVFVPGRAQGRRFAVRNGAKATGGVQQGRQPRAGSGVQGAGRMGSGDRRSRGHRSNVVGGRPAHARVGRQHGQEPETNGTPGVAGHDGAANRPARHPGHGAQHTANGHDAQTAAGHEEQRQGRRCSALVQIKLKTKHVTLRYLTLALAPYDKRFCN